MPTKLQHPTAMFGGNPGCLTGRESLRLGQRPMPLRRLLFINLPVCPISEQIQGHMAWVLLLGFCLRILGSLSED